MQAASGSHSKVVPLGVVGLQLPNDGTHCEIRAAAAAFDLRIA
jgi:hypothetical protein